MNSARAEPIAYCLADQDHSIIDCDQAFCELIRRDRSDVIGRHPLELTHPLDRRLNKVLLDGLTNTSAAFSITKRYMRGDGGLVWVTNGIAPVRDGIGRARSSATSTRANNPATHLALARNVDAAKRLCAALLMGKNLFGSDLVSAPGAELLLQLYTAEVQGRSLDGEALANAIQLSTAATVRWLGLLVGSELVEVERGEPVTAAASFRIAKRCELMLDALIVAADI